MNFRALARGLAVVLLLLCVFIIVPLIISLVEAEPIWPFLWPLVGVGVPCLLVFAAVPRSPKEIAPRDGFYLVSLAWVLVCVVGAVPFVLSGAVPSVADALFESTSGFTTAGSSVIADVESLPRGVLFWRSMAHWVGGMGIVVLAVAILPVLGVGGYQLIGAEAPGPTVERLTPRISHTARVFWLIYLVLTVVQTTLLLFGGLSLFDAVTHTFGTLATGGFSTRNASVAAFGNPYVEWVILVFMLLSGINFALYYRLVIRDIARIRRDSELKAYVALVVVAVGAVAFDILRAGIARTPVEALRTGGFQVATLLTSTGFATADYTTWPGLSQGILLLMLFVGGCVGSTSGGIKTMHIVVLFKGAAMQFKRLIHPSGVFRVHYNREPLEDTVVHAVAMFFFLYLVTTIVSTIVVAAGGVDLLSSLTGTLAALGNIGPGFGLVGPTGNFAFLPAYAKVWLAFVMILGRLEIWTMLVLLLPGMMRRW